MRGLSAGTSGSAPEHTPVNAGRGAFDYNGANGLPVEIHGTGTADDAVSVSFFPHTVEAGKKIITIRLDDAIFNYRTEKHLQALQNLFIADPRFDEKLVEGIDDSAFTLR